MKRNVSTILVPLSAGFLAWLAGYDFDYRGGLVAYWTGITMLAAGLIYCAPWWED